MFRIANCIIYEHDLVLVLVAAAICAVGALVTSRLLKRTMESSGGPRMAWTFLGGLAAGSTIWCTHFVAMLAYEPGAPVSYDPQITILSLIVAMLGSGVSFAIASERARFAPQIGGASFGITISSMHYVGMKAFTAQAHIEWDYNYVVTSVLASAFLGAAAFGAVRKFDGQKSVILGTVLLVLAIVALHFTGMAALRVIPFAVGDAQYTDDAARSLIVFAVSGIGLLVLSTGAISYVLDGMAQQSSDQRLRHLTDSAVDGMVVVSGEKVVAANSAFYEMAGLDGDDLDTIDMDVCLPGALTAEENSLSICNLQTKTGETVPVELLVRREGDGQANNALTVYALRDIRQRLENEQQISYLAAHDGLTGLRNRNAFLDYAQALLAEAGTTQLAMFAVDLDHFKETNDLHGHPAGDAVLTSIATRMTEVVQNPESIARLGGDEFVCLLPVASFEEADKLASDLSSALSADVMFEGRALPSGASIGLAVYPENGEAIEDLLNNADLAMYRAKSLGGGVVCTYDPSLDDATRKRRRLIEDLRLAVEHDELELHYQVQVNTKTMKVAGYEALLRWRHPERGMIPPSEFIPMAETSGLIVRVGEWVLRTACREAINWPDNYRVSVNVSPGQLNDAGFAEKVADILVETGLSATQLELEVTETCFIADADRAAKVLNELKALGIHISIDDFGTGYSSLSMLQAFPFDKIKLDKSLIDQVALDDKAQGVFRAVLSLGDALGVPVLAEGVETPDQLDYLNSQGCGLVQGYLYGQPQRDLVDPFMDAQHNELKTVRKRA